MRGALTNDQPARAVRFEDQEGIANRSLRGRRQTEQGAKPKKKRRKEERAERWLKNAYWFIFCCGLCEEWDLAAESNQHKFRVWV